jgi:pimeloyl-ACP methyl ester carboxylesterase
MKSSKSTEFTTKWTQILLCGVAVLAAAGSLVLLGSNPGKTEAFDCQPITGYWSISASRSVDQLPLILHITTNEDNQLIGVLNNPNDDNRDIAVDSINYNREDSRLDFTVAELGVKFSGSFSDDHQAFWGDWIKHKSRTTLALDRTTAPFAAQQVDSDDAYRQEEVVITNQSIILHGTLSMPTNVVRPPAILLISGTGPLNRDELISGHPIFRILARYLTTNGFAVLRMDKRGVGKSGGDFQSADSYDFADDATTALQYLRHRPDIGTYVGVVGHSEGAIIAEMLATRLPEAISGLVLMAGPGLDGDAFTILQAKYVAIASGNNDAQIQAINRYMNGVIEVLKSTPDNATAKCAILELFHSTMEPILGSSAQLKLIVNAQIDYYVSRWTRTFITLKPAALLAGVKCPVLALNGDRDVQVPFEEDISAIEHALRTAGNEHYKIERISGLNHLFQSCSSGAISEYEKIREDIAPVALATITQWLIGQNKGQ